MDAQVSCKALKTVIVVAVLSLAGAQSVFSQAPTCTTFNRYVTATISTVGDAASVDTDPACVASGGKVQWTAADGESWSTDFADDAHSPFAPGQVHHAGEVLRKHGDWVRACSTSDPVFDTTAGGCVFKYTAVHVKDGKTSTLDPQIIVQPGT
jgi:hypothetical protein